MKDLIRILICIVIGYVILWYAGAMFNFLPFAGELTIAATGFTGLLIITALSICTYLIIDAINKNKK